MAAQSFVLGKVEPQRSKQWDPISNVCLRREQGKRGFELASL